MRTFDQLTYEEAVAHLQRYVSALPAAAQRLRLRSDKTGGPTLDGSVDSVVPLEVWFHEQLVADVNDGLSGIPMWWLPGTENRTTFLGEPLPSLRQVRLIDETAAYLAEVLQRLSRRPGGQCTAATQTRSSTTRRSCRDHSGWSIPLLSSTRWPWGRPSVGRRTDPALCTIGF